MSEKNKLKTAGVRAQWRSLFCLQLQTVILKTSNIDYNFLLQGSSTTAASTTVTSQLTKDAGFRW